MANRTTKKNVVAFDDDLINRAIAAIDSIEPTPEELEIDQLAKLIPSLRMAIERGETHDKIRKKLKSVFPHLHYSKVESMLAAAAKLASEQHDHAAQNGRAVDEEVLHESGL